jgi:hypothetical protein
LVRRAGKAAGQGSSGGDGDEAERERREEVVVLLESKRVCERCPWNRDTTKGWTQAIAQKDAPVYSILIREPWGQRGRVVV